MRKASLWWALTASAAIIAANGCKSTTSTNPTANNNPVNGTGTRSALVAGQDPLSLNSKSPPPGPDLYVSTARVYEGTQDVAAAKEQYERALKLDSAYLPALLGYAHLLDTQKEFADADKYYQRAAKKHPDIAAVFNDWGMSQQRRGHLEQSSKLLTKAVELQPEKPLYRNNLAMVLVVLHRPQEAYRQLAAIETPAVAHFNVAALLHRAGDEQSAAFHFAEASKQDPSWAQAREWATRLGGPGAPPPNNEIAVSNSPRIPPPDPRPDPAAQQYEVASREPIVEQAPTYPGPVDSGPVNSGATNSGPLPSPEPQSSYAAPSNAVPNAAVPNAAVPNGAPPATAQSAAVGLPTFTGVEPGPTVTPTSGISYPMQYPQGVHTTGGFGPVEAPSPAAMPPLPPSGMPASGMSPSMAAPSGAPIPGNAANGPAADVRASDSATPGPLTPLPPVQ